MIIGVDDTGRKEILAVVDGYRESADSWQEVLTQLDSQGLQAAPELMIGDGALGLWNVVTKHWPTTRHQRCWVHKTANVLNKVPKTTECLVKDKAEMLAFYDFPAEH